MMEKSSIPYDTMSDKPVTPEPMFSKCCCCIPLRIGCFILGYLNLFFNFIRTMSIVGIVLYFGMKTHGFDHLDPITPNDGINDKAIRSLDSQTIKVLGWTLVLLLVFDLIWLAVNIACLVGIHMKRPGPIRAYVGFATFRLVFTLAGFLYQTHTFPDRHPDIIPHFFDLVLTAYFIFVYYIYAMRLEKEARESTIPQVQVNDIAYIYPTKVDKEHLMV